MGNSHGGTATGRHLEGPKTEVLGNVPNDVEDVCTAVTLLGGRLVASGADVCSIERTLREALTALGVTNVLVGLASVMTVVPVSFSAPLRSRSLRHWIDWSSCPRSVHGEYK